jgi:trimeric autotransporter adhesin
MLPTSLRTALLAAAATLLLSASQSNAAIIFVNAAQTLPTASQDGTSWATAYQDLRAAMLASPVGSEFWIAAGTYRPTTTTDRTLGFFAKTDQTLLGGFLPGATRVTDRDPAAHPTILSGDIGVPGFAGDNSEHVMFCVNVTGVVLDGLVIEDGTNEIDSPSGFGAGLRATNAVALVIQDCIIRRCQTASRGGGAFFLNADNAVIRRVTFENNVAEVGGGLEMQSAPMTFVACRFLGNASEAGAGGVFIFACNGSLFANCEFSGNKTLSAIGGSGGAMAISSGIAVHSSTFVGNSSANAGGAIRVEFSAVNSSVTNCLFADNVAPASPHIQNLGGIPVTSCGFSSAAIGGAGNAVILPALRDPLGPDGVRGTFDDDLRLTALSEAIDRGNGAALPDDIGDIDGDGDTSETLPVDAFGGPRLVDDPRPDTGLGGTPILDVGAHEFERSTRIYFVDSEKDGDGSTWEKAFPKIQSAFAAIQSEPQPKPVEVWVAEGTYLPGSDRNESFMPQGAVTLLGGFKGGEWSRSQRNPIDHPTILSGEIGASSTTADNTLHVVHFAGDNVFAETVLDGFVITAGNANLSGTHGIGGGILISGVARPTVRNCRVLGNVAKFGGGGIAVTGSGSRIAMTNCYVAGNASAALAGGMLVTGAADGSTIVNCTFAGNEAETTGGLAVVGSGSSACVLNTIFAENIDLKGDPESIHVAERDGGALTLSHCAVPCASTIPFGVNLVSLPPAFTLIAGADERIGTLDDDFTLSAGSACIDAGVSVATCAATVPSDANDLDDDGNLSETIAVDAFASQRVVDDPLRTNADPLFAIDIGAAERQEASGTPGSPGDIDGNGKVDGADLATLLGQWGTAAQDADLNGDCQVDAADLAVLLGGWTG